MNKIPHVERDILTGGLTTACAGLWCKFLAEEHHWEGNTSLSEYYERRSQKLLSGPRGSLHDRRLEETIKRWKR
jgi:hypothetical protein